MSRHEALAIIETLVDKREDDLVDLRRDLHAHPELSWEERRTTDLVSHHLDELGWQVTSTGESGLIADLGEGDTPRVALRADLDALPVNDTSGDPWQSRVPDVAHACGHDVHTTALLGAGMALAETHAAGLLPGRVRLLFQPAEEVMPGGATRLMELGALDEVARIYCLHCDPSLDVGQVGLREGAITGAADSLQIRLSGSGGHTSRPHLTEDLTFALGKIVTELPAVLSRRLDPRTGVSVVWGRLEAGRAVNVIPETGTLAGTVRMLDAVAWTDMEEQIRRHVREIVAPYGVEAVVDYHRGVPPVVNDALATTIIGRAAAEALGPHQVIEAEVSMGGEDFACYQEHVPGAMIRLGVGTPARRDVDIHQSEFDVDEAAIGHGVRVFVHTALDAIDAYSR